MSKHVGGVLTAGLQNCPVKGCVGFSLDGEPCPRCEQEITALREMAERRAERQAARKSRRPMELPGPDWIYMAASIAVIWYLMFEFRSFIWGCLELWFGR